MRATTKASDAFAIRRRLRLAKANAVLAGLWVAAILLLAVGCKKASHISGSEEGAAVPQTVSSFDLPRAGEKILTAGTLKFEQADLTSVMNTYAGISGRSVVYGTNLPEARITFVNQTPMSAPTAMQALDTVLAAQGMTTVLIGAQYVKVVRTKDAYAEPGPIIDLQPDQLPESSSFLIYIVKSKKVSVSQAVPALSPFTKLPNGIVAIGPQDSKKKSSNSNLPNFPISFGPDDTVFIFRDYSSNVRQMLKVLDTLEER